MNQTVVVDHKFASSILSQLRQLTSEVSRLRESVEEISPTYGSSAWWEKETIEALGEIKKGNVAKFDTVNELIQDLHS